MPLQHIEHLFIKRSKRVFSDKNWEMNLRADNSTNVYSKLDDPFAANICLPTPAQEV